MVLEVPTLQDSLGPVPIPNPPTIGAFPLRPDFGGGIDYAPQIVVHTFDQPGLKTEQRFLLSPSTMRRFRFTRNHLSCREYDDLKSHFTQAQGCYAQFPYTVHKPGEFTETLTVRYENPTIAFDYMVSLLVGGPGITFLEIPLAVQNYFSSVILDRFPNETLATALADQYQEIYPLITIVPRGGSPLYISNQKFNLDGQLYLPRLLDWSGISQSIGENSDAASFNFGNADGVWIDYVNQVNLYAAQVQFAMFHKSSGYRLNLWTGYATNWGFDTAGKFQINAADGMFQLSLAYPSRKILRTCWKVYRGRWCPASASNGFPDCPKDYDSCVARGVPHSFGGFVVPAQSVRIKDNSTGVFGFGRSKMTSVTVTQDTVYQRPLQEVYTDEPMNVTCDVAAGRDESDYYAALGIVGEGPISGYNDNLILQTLDGQPPHDPIGTTVVLSGGGVKAIPSAGGWRAVIGTEPSGPNDFVGITQAQRLPDGNISWALPPPGSTYCGGLAFAEIRRTDEKGLQLSPVSDRTMTVNVIGGIGGWVWNGPGDRNWLPALHNCVWVAINVWLRGLGLRVDNTNAAAVPAAVQEQYFDVEAAMEAAAICDTVVPKIIGDGNELQFPFRGVLKEQKPLRQWIQEILNCCLGYCTFRNGKLWIGIRCNSSVLGPNAFTRANILLKTLAAAPLQPQFNWLTGNFGDEEFGWQLNNVTIYDIDQAGFLGTPDSPQYLTNTMSFVGVSNKSQCARITTTRLREEIGGLKNGKGPHGTGSGIDEQLRARNFQFRTTVIALGTQVGDIISISDPKMPGGYAEGRVSRWALNPDWSIDIQASSTTDDMYDLVYGPKPDDVAALPVPPETLQSPTGLAWMPNELAPFPGDPIVPPWERTFDLWQDYQITRDGVWQPIVWVKGEMTINQFTDATVQPRITEISLAAGGALTGPLTVYAAITQRDANGSPVVPSNLTAIVVPQGASNQKIELATVPAAGSWASYDIWAGTDRRRLALQSSVTGALPATVEIAGPIHDMTAGLPEAAAWGIAIKAKHVWHAGVAGLLINAVTAPNQIQCNDFIGSTDNWINRVVFVISNVAGEVPVWDFKITAFDSATGTLTVSPNCVTPGNPALSVQKGDVLIVYAIATAAAADSITDTMWDNSVNRQQSNSTGFKIDGEKGRMVRILRGTGAGQQRVVTSNDHLTLHISPPWTVIPDNTSIMIVEAPDWPYQAESSQMLAATQGVKIELSVTVPNLADEAALVGAFLVDRNGKMTSDECAVYRMIYLFGQPPQVRIIGPEANDPATGLPWQTDITDHVVRGDTTATDITVQLMPLVYYSGRTLYIWNDGPGTIHVLCYPGELLFDGNPSIDITGTGSSIKVTAG